MEDRFDYTKDKEFSRELSSLLNKFGYDNKTDTPDFILAEHLLFSLKNMIITKDETNRWRTR